MEDQDEAILKYKILINQIEEKEKEISVGNATLEDIRIENDEINKLRKMVIDTTEDTPTSYTST